MNRVYCDTCEEIVSLSDDGYCLSCGKHFDNMRANGDANGLINPTESDEDFVDSFYEVPSVFNSNNSNEMCGNCDTYFPVEELCPVTHFCPKCLQEDREYEMNANFHNQD